MKSVTISLPPRSLPPIRDASADSHIESLLELLRRARAEFPSLKTHSASVQVETGNAKISYSVSVSRGEL